MKKILILIFLILEITFSFAQNQVSKFNFSTETIEKVVFQNKKGKITYIFNPFLAANNYYLEIQNSEGFQNQLNLFGKEIENVTYFDDEYLYFSDKKKSCFQIFKKNNGIWKSVLTLPQSNFIASKGIKLQKFIENTFSEINTTIIQEKKVNEDNSISIFHYQIKLKENVVLKYLIEKEKMILVGTINL